MTDTINFADGFIAEEELRLLETKHAILEKLRVRFSKLDENKGGVIIPNQDSGLSPAREIFLGNPL